VDTTPRFLCRSCGERHDGPPLAYAQPAPAYWLPELADDENSVLGEEQCVIRREHFFVRAQIPIPLLDHDGSFEWGVWVSLSGESFRRMSELWEQDGREQEPACFGWLAVELPVYEPSTLELRTRVHTQPRGRRPLVELEPTDHPLAVEQRAGITMDRVRWIAEAVLHSGRPE
jgi:hypothetical protein